MATGKGYNNHFLVMQRITITNFHIIYFELKNPIYDANIRTKMHFCHWNE